MYLISFKRGLYEQKLHWSYYQFYFKISAQLLASSSLLRWSLLYIQTAMMTGMYNYHVVIINKMVALIRHSLSEVSLYNIISSCICLLSWFYICMYMMYSRFWGFAMKYVHYVNHLWLVTVLIENINVKLLNRKWLGLENQSYLLNFVFQI